MIDPPLPPEIRCGTAALTVFQTPRQVDVDHVVPVVFAGLVERLTAVADAGIGDDDVQPPQLLDAAVDGALECVVVTHVDLGGHDAPVQTLDRGRRSRPGRRASPVAIWLLQLIGPQTSTAMMSAPSSASRTA